MTDKAAGLHPIPEDGPCAACEATETETRDFLWHIYADVLSEPHNWLAAHGFAAWLEDRRKTKRPEDLVNMGRDDIRPCPLEDAGEDAMNRWAEAYDDLNGAPENEEDR